ncbi:MMPL family transporter [Actinoplanes sp. TRM 88003]|uniref:MMPL family transporter n=1 Tax=Paractinoplanes aksuensis TaxID=2939490 RepID=A0ABT1DSV1_9ACTN|nr:MMPL family transporter [Actinoplanes aksuensis]MCO8273916.1 MMPL family transporter [Actinoplanes aksuensis]
MPTEEESSRRQPLTDRIAHWSAVHRKATFFGWLGLTLVLLAIGAVVGGKGPGHYDPGESGQAQRMVEEADGAAVPPTESILIQFPAGSAPFAQNTEHQQAVTEVVTALGGLGDKISNVAGPTPAEPRGLVSPDGRSALVTFSLAGPRNGWANAPSTIAASEQAAAGVAARHPGATVVQSGVASVDLAMDEVTEDDFTRAEIISIPLTLLILVLVFGALVAASVPLILAISAVAGAMGLLTLGANWLPVSDSASSLVLLVGMAVGVDYSLFYLRRAREERMAGRSVSEALRITAATSGRAVVISGLTVMVSMAGLFLTGMDTFTGMAFGTIAVVGLAVVGSITALPALLAMLKTRVDSARLPWLGRRRTAAGESKIWTAIVHRVVKRPLIWGLFATALLALAALPAFGMRLSDPSLQQRLPDTIPAIKNLGTIQAAFPGNASPAKIVVSGPGVETPAFETAVDNLRAQVAASGGQLREPVRTAEIGDGDTRAVYVSLAGTGSDDESHRALELLRDKALPASLGQVADVEFAVTGETAGMYDSAKTLDTRTPIVFAFVLGFAFLVLVAAFRSVAIPLISIAFNLLSIGAAYGLMTWIFQDGHGASLLGFTPYGGIISWLPLFMFVILFGLSMDYHVFILSRIRERWAAGTPNKEAVVHGIGGSAGVVTSAAAVMVAVFAVFAALSLVDYKMLGIGMAFAIAVDATIVRGVLLPAALTLLGDRSWALPRWLRWLPGITLEAPPEPAAEAPGPHGDDAPVVRKEDQPVAG